MSFEPTGRPAPPIADECARAKRLTDPELAAEYWCSGWQAERAAHGDADEADEHYRRFRILYDFAEREHASESDYR